MDYKYIEQLLERYWECQTTLQEEAILKAFFDAEDVPAHLRPYRDIFITLNEKAEEHLEADFDARVIAALSEAESETKVIPMRPISGSRRVRPFFKAAACIAIMLSIGMAASHSMLWDDESAPTSNVADVNGGYQSPDDVNNQENAGTGQVSARLDKDNADSAVVKTSNLGVHD